MSIRPVPDPVELMPTAPAITLLPTLTVVVPFTADVLTPMLPVPVPVSVPVVMVMVPLPVAVALTP